MFKKVVAVVVLGLVLGTAAVFADHPKGLGIGVQGGWSGNVGAGLSLKLPSVPVYWTVDATFGAGFGLGVAGDYYLFDSDFSPNFGWYLGLGMAVNLGFYDPLVLAVGARLPFGLSWQPIKLLEVYIQLVPSIGLAILPDFGIWPNSFSGNLGIRLWL
ncbi:hypothetical protein FACS1894130_06900 [Spirochaetia bacterium]|nr:hypothetical protein FACS1894130_06900 [Spirochaetia bacterium]